MVDLIHEDMQRHALTVIGFDVELSLGMDVTPTNEIERGFTIGVVVFALVAGQHHMKKCMKHFSGSANETPNLTVRKLSQGGLCLRGW